MQRRNQPSPASSEETEEAFHLLGCSLKRDWGQPQICTAIRVNNCLNQEYVDISGVVQPKANVRFSLIFNLNSDK
jgi:hypothetical protein